MRALDRHTIETLGVPGELLMESAGRAVAEAVLGSLPPGGSVLVVCGTRQQRRRRARGGPSPARARRSRCARLCSASAASLRGDAAASLRRARAAGVPIEGERWRAPTAGVIVDAIFGTGLSRAGRGRRGQRHPPDRREPGGASGPLRVVAVDLPSGLCADTGQVLGVAAPADVTVTLALPKPGLALEPGRTLAGRVRVARIGIAESAPGVALATRALDARRRRRRGCRRDPRPATRAASATRCWWPAPRARPARRRSRRRAPRAAAPGS